jgi:quercetin dioxygenase-like cupin family protein
LRHYHSEARQFFYVFSGTAVLETEGKKHRIPAGSGMEVAPGVQHKFIFPGYFCALHKSRPN